MIREKNSDLIKISKYISLILRHKPDAAEIKLDNHGWANVNELLDGVNKKYSIDFNTLKEIVKSDNKQRYSFNDDETKIRANQGHSIQVDVDLSITEPPEILYHGTAEHFTPSIESKGLISKNRLYVHLSTDKRTAENVGSRHGKPVIYQVSAKQMYRDGFVFYLSANGVWLTKAVPCEYLKCLKE